MKNCVYILLCRDNTLYTGWTNHLEERILSHQNGKGAKYTRGRRPLRLVYTEYFETKEEAMRREAQIKRLPRPDKLRLTEKWGHP